ncbi:MAG: hypothetical protein LBH77_06915 [Tannerella sp.]|jgi:hypothetical protein|nr:hypothetical protein [Tannerella sp.]
MRTSLFTIIGAVFLLLACEKAPETIAMQFDSSKQTSVFTWALKDVAPDLPSDWSAFNYLVLEMKASSPQRFSIGPVAEGGFYSKNIQPFMGAWLRFTIPLEYFSEPPKSAVDMAATYNKARKLGMVNIGGRVGALTGIDSIRFLMRTPMNNPTLEVRSITLSVDDPGEALLGNAFLVDRFGQWATKDWEDKIKNIEELKSAWEEENRLIQTPLFSDAEVSEYGGYKVKRVKATGFFRAEKIDGKWWFVDPDGYLFLSAGSDCINSSVRTTTKEREFVFEHLEGSDDFADFYRWNLIKRYGSEANVPEWVGTNVKRMKAWGLNTIANWSSPEMYNSNKIPFVLTLPGLQLNRGVMGLPDIYNPQYASDIDTAIGKMAQSYKDNPWLLGYFVGNEQPWPGQETLLCDRILSGSDTPMKKELSAWLKKNGDTPEAKRDFIHDTFKKFLGLVNATLKKHDPNHLNLGMRFGGHTSKEILAITAKHFDVFSFNCYEMQPSVRHIEQIAEMTGLPIIIGEYHFGVPDRGMSAGLVQVKDYNERGNAYRFYNEQGYSHPSVIGAHWFQWIDQANTGRMDGENYNIGILDITDRPYTGMVNAMKITHKRLYRVHSGELAPYDTQPITNENSITNN